MTQEQKKELLATKLNIDSKDISVDSNIFTIGNQEFYVLDENEAIKLAEDLCLEDLLNHDLSDKIIKIAEDNNLIDLDYFREIQEQAANDYIEELAYEGNSIFTVRLYKEMYDSGILSKNDFIPEINQDNKNQEHKINLNEQELDKKYEEFLEYLCADNPIDWYSWNYSRANLIKVLNNNKNLINLKLLAKELVLINEPNTYIESQEVIDLGSNIKAYKS